jgi:DNA-binding Lrp family transcriptional regulator
MTDKIAKNLSHVLNEKQAKTLLSLMRDGRLKDSELKEILGVKSDNAAAYHRRRLEKNEIIKRYRAVVNWGKLGYKKKFIILVETDDEKTFHAVVKNHILVTSEYLKRRGDVVILPVVFGEVILKDVLTCYGATGVIIGYATCEEAAKNYAEVYLKQIHPKIRTQLFLLKDMTIDDFFVQKDFIKRFLKMLQITDADKRFLREIVNRTGWK